MYIRCFLDVTILTMHGNGPTHRSPARWSALILALITLALFYDVLFTSRPIVLSADGMDITNYYLPQREFGFHEIRQRNLPFWNPYVLCGAPYAANFKVAIFYPFNWLHLALGSSAAINWIIAIQFFLAGWFAALWAAGKGTGVPGSALA